MMVTMRMQERPQARELHLPSDLEGNATIMISKEIIDVVVKERNTEHNEESTMDKRRLGSLKK